jgi:hypothetical protein
MDKNFYYVLLAIPATCVFWFLYATIATKFANWLTCRRLRNKKPTASVESPAKKPKAKTMRGFDYPELFFDDSFQRIRELQKRIAACDREIESLRKK